MRLAFRHCELQDREGRLLSATDLHITSVNSELKSKQMNCRSHMNTRTELCMTNEMSHRAIC